MEKRRGGDKRILKLSMAGIAVLLVSIAIAVTPVIAQEEAEVTVTVNAPYQVEEGQTFDVTIDVDIVTDLSSAQFDLSFDHKVVEVKKVTHGSIDDTEIPIYYWWDNIDSGIIKVISGFPEEVDTKVSGTGYLAKITFKVKGDEGDERVLGISGKLFKLVETEEGTLNPEKMSVDWIGAEIIVGIAEEEEEEEEEEPPDITVWYPAEAVVSSTEGESITFEITVDQRVDISWQINGTEVQTEESVTGSIFTKSADAGTGNVSAIATNTETGLSIMHTWIWSVAPTEAPEETPTPTPTLVSEETPGPTSTLAPGETPAPEAEAETEGTPMPTAPPTEEKQTQKPGVPGFEAVFAIAVMSGIAYILNLKKFRR
ncbi:MAG: hypothetical protein KAV25_01060 [Methanophagales archaeon]|nr:hypothetical protein [Methanophagales archaeon]